MSNSRFINFGAGPSALPESVLRTTAQALLDFNGTGIGIAEISHRSKEFGSYIAGLESLIRDQLDVPLTHRILFTQGGGTAQFSAVVLNLLARHTLLHPDLPNEKRIMDYVLTGSWSKAAAAEAQRLGGGRVNIAADARLHSADAKSFDNIPPHDSYNFSADPALIYYCENETVNGVQFSHILEDESAFPFAQLPQNKLLTLVADYSSSFMSRRIPRLADHAVIYAGAQKNVGPAGLTILIVREDCLVDVNAAAFLGANPVPLVMSYKWLADQGSLPHTPPVVAIYMAGLVLQRNAQLGGVAFHEAMNKRKKEKVYQVLKEGEKAGVLKGHVKEGSGSWMNIVFVVLGEGAEARFLKGAEEEGMKGLKGHRSVGGIRISLYNAISEEETNTLVNYIREFIKHSAGLP